MRKSFRLAISALLVVFASCSSDGYKRQEYAKLSNTKDFEEEFEVVWKGVVSALGEYKIEKKDQESGVIETDWIYSTSNDKYIEYQVNGFPRKKYLQTRYKFLIPVERQPGKIKVTVNSDEEIEKLKSDGTFDSWRPVSEPDTARANEMLKNIELKVLSRP